jgi:hypothetical protein
MARCSSLVLFIPVMLSSSAIDVICFDRCLSWSAWLPWHSGVLAAIFSVEQWTMSSPPPRAWASVSMASCSSLVLFVPALLSSLAVDAICFGYCVSLSAPLP